MAKEAGPNVPHVTSRKIALEKGTRSNGFPSSSFDVAAGAPREMIGGSFKDSAAPAQGTFAPPACATVMPNGSGYAEQAPSLADAKLPTQPSPFSLRGK
jgi:hypothetical protein